MCLLQSPSAERERERLREWETERKDKLPSSPLPLPENFTQRHTHTHTHAHTYVRTHTRTHTHDSPQRRTTSAAFIFTLELDWIILGICLGFLVSCSRRRGFPPLPFASSHSVCASGCACLWSLCTLGRSAPAAKEYWNFAKSSKSQLPFSVSLYLSLSLSALFSLLLSFSSPERPQQRLL